MRDLLFPFVAIAVTFFVITPLMSLLSLKALEHRRQELSLTKFGSESTFGWLVAPTLLPLVWLVSSAIHQAESVVAEKGCTDTVVLLGVLLVGFGGFITFRLWRESPEFTHTTLSEGHPSTQRVRRIVSRDRRLRKLEIDVVHSSPEPLYTHGLLTPKVVIDACFVEHVDDAMLHAALLHEHAHIRSRDTVRNFVVRLSLAINPLGNWLRPDFERWRTAREAACDQEAVHHGGDALALAEGIVCAVRFRCESLHPTWAALAGPALALKLRLALLVSGPEPPLKSLGYRALFGLGILAIWLPHIQSLAALDFLHAEVERLLHL